MQLDDKKILDVKKQFMIFRNGALADTLRQAGYPHAVIFGLNVPQIADIARPIGFNSDAEMARALWSDSRVRESRLLAAYLFPVDLPQEEALEICRGAQTPEEADMLVFRWIRRRGDMPHMLQLMREGTTQAEKWCATAIARFLDD